MAKVSRTETVDYVAKLIKSKPDMAYADVVKEGRKAGYHVYPLIMGLAKNALGMGRPKRGPGRPRGKRPGRPPMARRGRPAGRPGRAVSVDLVRSIERMHTDAAAMRSALQDIARLASKF